MLLRKLSWAFNGSTFDAYIKTILSALLKQFVWFFFSFYSLLSKCWDLKNWPNMYENWMRGPRKICALFSIWLKNFFKTPDRIRWLSKLVFFFFTLSVIYFFLFYYFFMCICTYILTGSKKTVKIFTVITESFMLQDNSSSWFTQST